MNLNNWIGEIAYITVIGSITAGFGALGGLYIQQKNFREGSHAQLFENNDQKIIRINHDIMLIEDPEQKNHFISETIYKQRMLDSQLEKTRQYESQLETQLKEFKDLTIENELEIPDTKNSSQNNSSIKNPYEKISNKYKNAHHYQVEKI